MGLFLANEVKSLYVGDKAVVEVYLGNEKIWSRGYEWIDLGLPSGLLWASTNVGASKPEEFGLYFAWGETLGYTDVTIDKQFTLEDYKWCNGSETTLTKYNNNLEYGVVDNSLTLELEDDAAYQSDNTCRMPTKADFEELMANTTSTLETLNGVNGRRFTSNTNGNSIFIPAAGRCRSGSVDNVGAYCGLWSTSLDSSKSVYAYYLYSNERRVNISNYYRYYGYSIRPVKSIN